MMMKHSKRREVHDVHLSITRYVRELYARSEGVEIGLICVVAGYCVLWLSQRFMVLCLFFLWHFCVILALLLLVVASMEFVVWKLERLCQLFVLYVEWRWFLGSDLFHNMAFFERCYKCHVILCICLIMSKLHNLSPSEHYKRVILLKIRLFLSLNTST